MHSFCLKLKARFDRVNMIATLLSLQGKKIYGAKIQIFLRTGKKLGQVRIMAK